MLLLAITKILFLGHCSGNDVSGRDVDIDRDLCLCFAVQKGPGLWAPVSQAITAAGNRGRGLGSGKLTILRAGGM